MSNYCNNSITITGNKRKIAMLTRVIEDLPKKDATNEIVFETLIGLPPDDFVSDGVLGVLSGWFGTKWDVNYNECNFQFTESSISLSPPTAWSPPNCVPQSTL